LAKAKVPKFRNREEEAAFWDTHSLTDYLDEIESVDVEIKEPLSHVLSVRIDSKDAKELETLAKGQGVGITTMARVLLKQALIQHEHRETEGAFSKHPGNYYVSTTTSFAKLEEVLEDTAQTVIGEGFATHNAHISQDAVLARVAQEAKGWPKEVVMQIEPTKPNQEFVVIGATLNPQAAAAYRGVAIGAPAGAFIGAVVTQGQPAGIILGGVIGALFGGIFGANTVELRSRT